MSSIEVFVLFLSFICCSSALYFHIGETEKKCFIEDIPDETMVVGEVARRVYCKQLVSCAWGRIRLKLTVGLTKSRPHNDRTVWKTAQPDCTLQLLHF